ncbi:hypothetical protein F2P79_023947 [Pimephales promelas]|nr:hypothetical protein F2P79_023947 [Pimephales promelas]
MESAVSDMGCPLLLLPPGGDYVVTPGPGAIINAPMALCGPSDQLYLAKRSNAGRDDLCAATCVTRGSPHSLS